MGQQVSQAKFLSILKWAKDHYYGNLGLKSLTPEIREKTAARIDELIRFIRDPNNYNLKNEIGVANKAAPGFNMKDDVQKKAYDSTSDNVLNAARKIRDEAARSKTPLSDPEIADAADVLAKSSVFTMLVTLMDPVLEKDVEMEEEEEEESDATYTPIRRIDPEVIVEPITFLIGAEVSRDSGIDAFVNMSPESAARLNTLLEAAWLLVSKYSAERQKAHMSEVDWDGSVRSFFFSNAPGESLRHCLTVMAAKHYSEMMLAAWEFLYLSVQDKRPSLTHSIIKGLESLTDGDGNPVLSNTITVNVDGLEFAAGISDVGIIPAHGSVLLRQPIDSKIGEAKASEIKSLEEIRSGKYRPAMVLYGEDVLPTAEDLDNVAKDAGGGTLIIVGASLNADTELLENMQVTTTIVVNSDYRTADDTLALINESSEFFDAGGKGLVVVGPGADDDDEEEVIKGFSTTNSFALRTPSELEDLLFRVYDFGITKHIKTTSGANVMTRLTKRINEFVE
jgi:NAD-dependent SIR2 family protein deacetylase